MPLLRTETIHGWPCKFYDNDVVVVGTTTGRFSIKLPASEDTWFATRLRAELIKRELATADELVVDEAGEAAMTAFNAAKERAAASIAASKVVREAEIKRDRVAAALNAAQHNEANAGLKRQLAQGRLTLADMQVKVAKAATPLMSEKATSKTVPLRATLDAFLRPAPPK